MRSPKIFGIGLSKTGTSALGMALTILGEKAKHLPKFMYTEDGQFAILPEELEAHTALTDTPVARGYKDLDKQFPGSKFILTIRDSESWLRSCKFHFLPNKPFCNSSDFQRMRTELYGALSYDEQLFTEAYERHLHDVQSYFEGRENDLLVMNIVGGDDWETLCPFLQKDIPDVPFPHTHKTRSIHMTHKLPTALQDKVWLPMKRIENRYRHYRKMSKKMLKSLAKTKS